MKTKVLGLVVWAIVLLMAACTNGDEYTNVIPKDASLVVSSDFRQMAEKCELIGEDGKMIADKLASSVRGELNDKELELFNKVLSHPEESGLDLRKNVYLFSTSGMKYSAALAAVSDYNKLNSLTGLLVSQHVCDDFTEENGFRYSSIDEKSLIIYNERAFLVLFSESGESSDKLKEVALEWFSNDKDKSYISSEEYQKMSAANADIVISGSLDCLPEEHARLLAMNMPRNVSLKDMAGVFAIHFNKGQLLVDVETMYKSEEALKQAKKQEKMYAGKIKGKFLDRFVDNSMLYLSFSCDGDEFYSMLMENELMKEQLESDRMPFDPENVLSSLDGEVALAIAEGKLLPQIALYAEVENDDILKELKDYEVALKLAQMEYGVEDGILYISNMKEPKAGKSLENVESGKASKGKMTYLTLDFKSLSSVMRLLAGSSQARQIDMVANYLKSVTIYNDDITHSHIVFASTDSETNVLKQIVDLGKEVSGI